MRFSRSDSREKEMRRFVEGVDRGQSTLFPECLEDWICGDNPVRAIDVFVGGLEQPRCAILCSKGTEGGNRRKQSCHPSLTKVALLGAAFFAVAGRRFSAA